MFRFVGYLPSRHKRREHGSRVRLDLGWVECNIALPGFAEAFYERATSMYTWLLMRLLYRGCSSRHLPLVGNSERVVLSTRDAQLHCSPSLQSA
jgi:hypothetical protein